MIAGSECQSRSPDTAWHSDAIPTKITGHVYRGETPPSLPMPDDTPTDPMDTFADDPFCSLLGIILRSVSAGTAQTQLTITDDHLNFHGIPHGGAIYSLADAAFAAASNSHGESAVAMETHTSYLESVETGATLTATATEIHRTRRTGAYEITITDEHDQRIASFYGRAYRP